VTIATVYDYVEKIKDRIETITQSNGYSYDIGSINAFDNALSTYPAIDVKIEKEESISLAMNIFGIYKSEITIKIKPKLSNVADRPQDAIWPDAATVLNDIKGLFLLSDAGVTVRKFKQGFFSFVKMEPVNTKTRSVFTSKELISKWSLTYQV
jgi:hypothetical protein